MPAMSVGGLASGLDTNNIIAQLTALEQAKVTREVKKKENAQSTLDKFKELETKLLSIQTKAKTLELPKDFNVFKSTSNYEDYATISGGEGATAGQYGLVVHQLATTQKVASNSFSAVNKSMVELGLMERDAITGKDEDPITIYLSLSEAAKKADPKKGPAEIKINASDTLKDIVSKINAAEGTGVRASIMSMSNGDNRIVLTAVDSGTNAFYITDNTSETGRGRSFLSDLGIIDIAEQKATSGNALTVLSSLGGGPATEETTFDQLNTTLNKNHLANGDKIGIYLPANCGRVDAITGEPVGGWVTFDLYDGAGKARKIGDVLTEINDQLAASGANFEASLNSSGEIVILGNLEADDNFTSKKDPNSANDTLLTEDKLKPENQKTFLEQVKIQIGTFNKQDEDLTRDDAAITVKKDMGTLANRNIFKEENIITEAQNAFYSIDGMSVSSQSNEDDKTIAGTTFTLKKVTEKDQIVRLTLDPDMSALADKISEFVEEFNELLKFIDENSKAEVVEETDKSGKKVSNRVVGPFTGDAAISSLRENLRSMFSSTINEIAGMLNNGYKTTYSAAARVGIVATKEGYYEVDKEKLTKALNSDFEGVRKLFTSNSFSDTPGFSVGRFTKDSEVGVYKYINGEWYLNGSKDPVKGTWVGNSVFTTSKGLSIELPSKFTGEPQVTFIRGIAGKISNFVEQAKTGYYDHRGEWVDGFIKQSKDKYQDRIDDIQKRVDLLQWRVDNYENRLIKQFTALEKSMSSLQSQSANMLAAIGSMNNNNKK
ncbi:MAG: flagellar filament capping protein FliD [Fibromonadaceae bacterium]|jgi:flagellar capping protein FliD|nr:flagellar filament capping protein FliD [Fibromonadaceae bacterium]